MPGQQVRDDDQDYASKFTHYFPSILPDEFVRPAEGIGGGFEVELTLAGKESLVMWQVVLNGALIAAAASIIAFAASFVISRIAKFDDGMGGAKFRLTLVIAFVLSFVGVKMASSLLHREVMREVNREEIACWKAFKEDVAQFEKSTSADQWGYIFSVSSSLDGESESERLLFESVKIDAEPDGRKKVYLSYLSRMRDMCLENAKISKEARLSRKSES